MAESYEREALELAAILDSIADGVFVIGEDHAVRRWNRAMTALTGYAPEEALGRSCAFLSPDCARPARPGYVLDCDLFAEGKLDNREMRVRRKDGSEAPVIASARVIYGQGGRPDGAVITLKDLSSVKVLEREVDRLRREVGERHEFHRIIGKSHAMQEVFSLIEMASASTVTVLIRGETGAGKELVARAIHYHSDRRDGPLITVNCSALSESLLESELFGHVKGAFTGAIKDHPGRFERAHGGTLFLDEAGELPASIQVKLLRVLQEREFERVGDTRVRRVDVRVIAATHRDLRRLVAEGAFREDLFYRLNVFPIHLPPLRGRKDDIEPLVRRFIERFREQTGKPITGVDPDAMRIIMDYCWPGNVRELENAIEHAFVTCPGGAIGPFDLPIEIRRLELQREVCSEADEGAAEEARFPIAGAAGAETGPPRRRGADRDEMLRALEASGWNKAEAARRLGITRTSVWRRMRALGIPMDPSELE